MLMQFKKPGGHWPAEQPLDTSRSWLLDGEQEPVETTPQNKKKGFKLQELYQQLDCDMVEVVPLGDSGLILICDEEGKFRDVNTVNVGATLIWWDLVPHAKNADVIVGKAIICKTELLK